MPPVYLPLNGSHFELACAWACVFCRRSTHMRSRFSSLLRKHNSKTSLNLTFNLNTLCLTSILFTWLKFTCVNVRSQKRVSGIQPSFSADRDVERTQIYCGRQEKPAILFSRWLLRMGHLYLASIRLNGMHRMQSDQPCFDHLSKKLCWL